MLVDTLLETPLLAQAVWSATHNPSPVRQIVHSANLVPIRRWSELGCVMHVLLVIINRCREQVAVNTASLAGMLLHKEALHASNALPGIFSQQ